MKRLLRTVSLGILAALTIGAVSGCVVVPERGYYHGGYNGHYWER